MSSANLPRPRRRRFSSLRGRDLPTHFVLSDPTLFLRGGGGTPPRQPPRRRRYKIISGLPASHQSISARFSFPAVRVNPRQPKLSAQKSALPPAMRLSSPCRRERDQSQPS